MSAEPARRPPPEDESSPASGRASDQGRIDHALHLAALREHSLLSLSELSQNLSASPDLFHMADLVLYNLMGRFGTAKAALWLLSSGDRTAVLIRAHGISQSLARATGAACEATLLRDAAVDLQPVPKSLIGEVFGTDAGILAERTAFEVMAVVTARETPIGLVALGPRIGGLDYASLEMSSLQASCSVLGTAIQNLNLHARMAGNNLELRRANEELKELARLKSELLSNVSHELRTPLTIIIGYLELLVDPLMSREREREIMPIVVAEARKLNDMVGRLLTLSASSQGKLVLQMETGDIGNSIRLFCEERRPLINSYLREFTWSIEPGLPPVRFDRTRFMQVVEALVENATKFTPQGTLLRVVVRQVPDGARTAVAIEVTDSGPGIAPERLPHVFESFQQGDGSATRTIGGMGIGLSYSRQLVEAMGGRIEVRSELGRGTTFTISLAGAGTGAPASGAGTPSR